MITPIFIPFFMDSSKDEPERCPHCNEIIEHDGPSVFEFASVFGIAFLLALPIAYYTPFWQLIPQDFSAFNMVLEIGYVIASIVGCVAGAIFLVEKWPRSNIGQKIVMLIGLAIFLMVCFGGQKASVYYEQRSEVTFESNTSSYTSGDIIISNVIADAHTAKMDAEIEKAKNELSALGVRKYEWTTEEKQGYEKRY